MTSQPEPAPAETPEKEPAPPAPAAPTPSVRVHLKPGEEKRCQAGHLWIFSNEIAKIEGDAQLGDLAEVLSASGKMVGLAFYNPHSLIAARLLTSQPRPIDAAFFKERLKTALALRERLHPGESAYRLCFGESDGLPGLVVDRYGQFLVLQSLSAGIERRLPLIDSALRELLAPAGIYLKNDHRSRALEGLKAECRTLSGAVPDDATIVQGGLTFKTQLAGGQKTGFYFDQAENREFLRPYFKGRSVLDLYCYSGAFSVNAAKFGAAAALGIDSSGPAIECARENAALNGVGDVAQFEEDDAEEVLSELSLHKTLAKPDMIILDPPNLVQSKKNLSAALRRYVKLNAAAIKNLKPGGLLATATCSHHVDRESFVEMLRAAQTLAGKPSRLLALRGQALDHPVLLAMPETEYLHFALLEILPRP